MLLMLIYGDADDATDAADNMVIWYCILSSLWHPHCGYWCCTSIHPGVEICGKKCSANGQMGKLPRWSLTSCNHQLNLTKLAPGQKLMWYNDTAYPTSKLSKSTLGRAPKASISYLRLYFLLLSHQWDWIQLFFLTPSLLLTSHQFKMSTHCNYFFCKNVMTQYNLKHIYTLVVHSECVHFECESSRFLWIWRSFHKSYLHAVLE